MIAGLVTAAVAVTAEGIQRVEVLILLDAARAWFGW